MSDASSKEMRELESRVLMQTYRRLPIVIDRGEGCYVWDRDGKRYLDLIAGIAVDALGHSHPRWIAAVTSQAQKLVHTSNLFYTEPMIRLAERLTKYSGMERVFFCNSGTEATEAAIKIARKWGKVKRGASCFKIVTFERGFHGRTLGALSATATPKYCAPFEPLVPGFMQVAIDDKAALESLLDVSVCAVMIEPIQGEGGVWAVAPERLREIRQLCSDREVLFICDEIQTGIGRTGTWFAYQHAKVLPDLIPLAKGLGGGFPIGACLASGSAATVLEPGDHGSTFGGNPLACAAGLAVVEEIERGNLLDHVTRAGAFFERGLQSLVSKYDMLDHTRGMGLMRALETKTPIARQLVARAVEYELLLNATGDTTLRFLPPLVISEFDLEFGLQQLDRLLADF